MSHLIMVLAFVCFEISQFNSSYELPTTFQPRPPHIQDVNHIWTGRENWWIHKKPPLSGFWSSPSSIPMSSIILPVSHLGWRRDLRWSTRKVWKILPSNAIITHLFYSMNSPIQFSNSTSEVHIRRDQEEFFPLAHVILFSKENGDLYHRYSTTNLVPSDSY